jgi:formate hydrogenlyase transcriptional activator
MLLLVPVSSDCDAIPRLRHSTPNQWSEKSMNSTHELRSETALGKFLEQEPQQPASALQSLIDVIPAILWRAKPDGSIEFFNQRFYEYTRLSPEEARGSGWQFVIHPEDLAQAMTHWHEVLASGQPGEMEVRMRRFDDVYRWFLVRAVPKHDEQCNIIKWYGSNTDIEDRKRAEEKLRDDERELRGMVDTIPHVIHVFDADGSFLYANRPVREFTGLSLEDVRKPDFRARIFHPEDMENIRLERERALVRGTSFEFEMRARRHDGQYRWFLIRYNPLKDEQDRIIRWYATGMDIEDRKRAEQRTQNENLALREDIIRSSMCEEIVGSSVALLRTLSKVEKVAPSDSTVLITGETGTGKELIARTIHRLSKRSAQAFIRVNCAAIPASLIASELFGHEKGAFTGAVQRRVGRFESADGGTIFLDEIGDLPAETQIALLRVLQEREFERVGSNQPIHVNVRVIAATHRNLKGDVAAGTFRQDLFYRLEVFPIHVPSLRERMDDIPLLLEYLITRYSKKAGKHLSSIPSRTLELFQAYDWPGNIRELQNVVERAVLLSDGGVFEVDEAWLKCDVATAPGAGGSLASTLDERERGIIEAALTECNGRISGLRGAAAKLGMPRQTLDSRITTLNIDKRRFRAH